MTMVAAGSVECGYECVYVLLEMVTVIYAVGSSETGCSGTA